MAKSLIDYQAEAEKICEWVRNNRPESLNSFNSFQKMFKSEMNDGLPLNSGASELERQVWDLCKPDKEEEVFSKAGGKNLQQDKRPDAKIIFRNSDDFNRLGASRSDLQGLDTKPKFVNAEIKGRIVRAKSGIIVKQGKTFTVYRDQRGRFAKR